MASYWVTDLPRQLGTVVLRAIERHLHGLTLALSSLLMLLLPAEDNRRVAFSAIERRILSIGLSGLPMALLFGATIGLVLGSQLGRIVPQLDLLDIWLASATEVLARHVAPVLGAILLASRSGAALAADLGTMRASGEIDALRGMGLSPQRMLIAPSIWAALLCLPLLVAAMIASAALTLALYLNLELAMPILRVLPVMLESLSPELLLTALAKAAAFGILVMGLAASAGQVHYAMPRTVGRHVTEALVTGVGSMLVLNALWTALST